MDHIIVYKRIPQSDRAALLRALSDGYVAMMPSTNGNGVQHHASEDAKPKRRAYKRRIYKKRRARTKPGPVPTKAKNIRNEEMAVLAKKGWSKTAIGKRYGISCPRVCQILAGIKAGDA
jgi:hypothetical protein